MAIYMKVTGQKQGLIKGSVGAKAFEDQIPINSAEFGIGGTFDAHSGHATGRRVARPLKVVKPLDKSTPLLFTSCDTNETMTKVLISYTKEGADHKAFFTIELTNGMVHDFNQQASHDGTAVETISFSYTKAEITWVDGGISAVMDWVNPTST